MKRSPTAQEQKLVDLCFAIGMMTSKFRGRSNEQIADWITLQLQFNGFDTAPRGMSWGALTAVEDQR